jgi:uncharacterized membrane protein YcfT
LWNKVIFQGENWFHAYLYCVNGHLSLDSVEKGLYVAFVRGTGYRLAMSKVGVTGV